MNQNTDYTPVALYARVSSDRQDVDLSISAQLRALRDYAQKNGYIVAREYVDEAESGRIADRPEFRKMIDVASQAQCSRSGRFSSGRHNSNGKLRYSWEVDLGPFKLGRITRQ